MNYTWNNKVSDQQNNVICKEGVTLNKVESHHQLTKAKSGLQAEAQDCTHQVSPAKSYPRAKHSPKKPTASNVKRSPQRHLFWID